jgi:hypothetical protein
MDTLVNYSKITLELNVFLKTKLYPSFIGGVFY